MQINFNSNADILCHRYYMHGRLQQLLNTDLVGCSKKPPFGIYKCTVNNEFNCICFSWKSKLGWQGLIILQDDTDEVKIECLNKFLCKVTYL